MTAESPSPTLKIQQEEFLQQKLRKLEEQVRVAEEEKESYRREYMQQKEKNTDLQGQMNEQESVITRLTSALNTQIKSLENKEKTIIEKMHSESIE